MTVFGYLSQRVQVPNFFRLSVPNTIEGMAFGTRVLKYWVLGPSGAGNAQSRGSQLRTPFRRRNAQLRIPRHEGG